ncbi:hypothetical protein KKH23_03915 [Patescibacteria group bacterium]|nr:hypothetical protein [Patescibacteria group bacterium]MBU0776739.1 hypothetical protein [Patescibacteria group bacterium]MBU0846312.1 hypothetical protein [Patescibacteria group bacterium]MBU0922728.1 hypothetical protein [Patescibacteria group bacterium]MBU1066245.1 hypothetical protein [Patescibacteria group bacterium]
MKKKPASKRYTAYVVDGRRKKIRRRKNFFPTLIVTFISWLGIAAIIYFINPSTLGIVPLFFSVFFIALLFTFSTLLANSKRGLVIASTATLFLLLRYLGVGNIINFLLIIGLGITTDLYLSRSH